MMTGIGVHHGSESVFTFGQNERSGWSGIRILRMIGTMAIAQQVAARVESMIDSAA
jgi:hypothetical protein